jgi:outer membrane lipoprotein SlyB
MNTRKTICAALVALVPLSSMTLAVAPAQAQSEYNSGPAIRGFNMNDVHRLTPGTDLNFDVYGTPGGWAEVRIDGATRNLHLTETQPGVYQGTYTIGEHDRIRPGSSVTANLRMGDRVASNILTESIIGAGARGDDRRRGDLALVPRIQRFNVRGNDDLAPGNELIFTVHGTPNAKVNIAIAGTRGVFFLPEVRPGEYSGVYTVRRNDDIRPDSQVTATIRAQGRYSTAVLGEPLLAGGARYDRPRDDRARDDRAWRDERACAECGTVEAVNVVELDNNGSPLGTIGGAVVGGLLGSAVGSGGGRTAAEVAGAVGGAVVGNNIAKNSRGNRVRYDVVVRYGNGATQTVSYSGDPGVRVGDHVRVDNGRVTRE